MAPFTGANAAGQNALSGIAGSAGAFGSNYGAGASGLATQASPGSYSGAQGTANQANGALSSYLNSNYTNPYTNPGFSSAINTTLAKVIPQVSASFINGGRSDSGLAQAATTSAATDAVGNLVANQYNQNVTQQQNAANLANQNYATQAGLSLNASNALQSGGLTGMGVSTGAANDATNGYLNASGNQIKGAAIAPTIDQQQMSDLSTGLGAATMSQTDAQNNLNANIAGWNYNQMLPYNNLNMYMNEIGSPTAGQSSTTTPYYTNPMSNLLSGAAGGASLYNGLNKMSGGIANGIGNWLSGATSSANDQYANPYGATGLGQVIQGNNGMLGGGT
jgi:hypothetical protein